MKSFYKTIFFTIVFALNVSKTSAQIAIGQWRDHLSYQRATDLVEAGNKIYCVADGNLFSFNKEDGSVERISKVNGLSDVGINRVNYDKKRKILLIAYSNANIDIIENGTIINISDIKRKEIAGSKSINSILVDDDVTYLSCGFGIVVLDLDKKEVKDTYYLSNNNQSVNELLISNNTFYAATTKGVYFANKANPNLSNPINWTIDIGLPLANYNAIVVSNNKLIVNKVLTNAGKILQRNIAGGAWSDYPNGDIPECFTLKAYGTDLYIVYSYGVTVRDASGVQKNYLGGGYGYPQPGIYPAPKNVILDSNNSIWVADNNEGLVENDQPFHFIYRSPEGPNSNSVYALSFNKSQLWVAPGSHSDTWDPVYNHDGVSGFYNNQWSHKTAASPSSSSIANDILLVKQNPLNENALYAASFRYGLEVYKTDIDTPSFFYNQTNSTLKQWAQNLPLLLVSGFDFDKEGNIWVANAHSPTIINVLKKSDGKWQAFNTAVAGDVVTSTLIVTQSNQKWVIVPRVDKGGILVFDDNGTISNTSDDKIKKLGFTAGNGGMAGAEVLSMAEDQNGEIWVGTNTGINVFYSPALVFSNENFDAQQIKIEQDGNIQYLLETEVVTAIAVDGANRKWVGTESSGVYFMSSDGTQQLAHFTEDNSPLFSNNITSIAINQTDGEVFIGTDRGIVSYKSTATEGAETCDIFAYPNPVKDKYACPPSAFV